jgi:hypothetical protein
LNGIAVISTVEGEHTAAGFTTVNVGNGFTVTSTDFTVKASSSKFTSDIIGEVVAAAAGVVI